MPAILQTAPFGRSGTLPGRRADDTGPRDRPTTGRPSGFQLEPDDVAGAVGVGRGVPVEGQGVEQLQAAPGHRARAGAVALQRQGSAAVVDLDAQQVGAEGHGHLEDPGGLAGLAVQQRVGDGLVDQQPGRLVELGVAQQRPRDRLVLLACRGVSRKEDAVADSSFDVVAKVDRQEVDNAVNQARKELAQRFDFKNTGTSLAWSGDEVVIVSKTDQRALAALDVFKEKLVKRSVSLKGLTSTEPRPAGGGTYRVECTFLQGIPEDKAKALAKTLRQSGLKVQAQVQGDQLRVTGKSKNDLQQAIALLKERDEGLPLRFTNYR